MTKRTSIKVKGHYRTLKSGKKIYIYPYHRYIKVIPLEKARRHFKSLPKKTQQRDLARSSKKPYRADKIPPSYIKKGGTKQMDVKGLDTAKTKRKKKKR